MKTHKPLINLTASHLQVALALLSLCYISTGCAVRGPKRVYASRAVPPTIKTSPLLQGLDTAPRTQAGKVMDPEVETLVQEPSRIIYFPGEHGIFGRQSPRQEVAYTLKPINRGEGLPGPKVSFEEAPGDQPSVFQTGFLNKDGSVTNGEGRRLGVNAATQDGKDKAEALLKKGEELKWSASVGWIGFKATQTTKPTAQTNAPVIPDLPKEAPHGKPPGLDTISGENIKPITEKKDDEDKIDFNGGFK